MDLLLKDQVVIVTGGAKGIGAAISQAFINEGAKVAIITRHSAESEAFAKQLSTQGEVFYYPLDLNETAKCADAIEAVVQHFGQLNVLVNNAGINDGASLEKGLEAFEKSLQANLLHVYAMAHFALPHLRKTKGNIVNIGSKVAETGQGNTSGYAASKGAMNALTREWALDLSTEGLRVNAVIPAECMTPLYRNWLNTLPNPDETLKKIESTIPLERRMTMDTELAATTVFVASSRSSHTTGQILYVDGGYTHLDRSCTVR